MISRPRPIAVQERPAAASTTITDKPSKPLDTAAAVPSSSKSPEEKLRTLRAYRRARGLCIRCAEKWSQLLLPFALLGRRSRRRFDREWQATPWRSQEMEGKQDRCA